MADTDVAGGRAALEARDWVRARSLLEDAIAADPAQATPDVLDGLADARWWNGDVEPALEARERAVRLWRARGDVERAVRPHSARLGPRRIRCGRRRHRRLRRSHGDGDRRRLRARIRVGRPVLPAGARHRGRRRTRPVRQLARRGATGQRRRWLPAAGMPATGRAVEVGGCDVFRVRDGEIVEAWWLGDFGSMLMQIGAVGAPAG